MGSQPLGKRRVVALWHAHRRRNHCLGMYRCIHRLAAPQRQRASDAGHLQTERLPAHGDCVIRGCIVHGLDALEDARRALAGAHAHGDHAVLQVVAAQGVHHSRCADGASRPQGVTQRN